MLSLEILKKLVYEEPQVVSTRFSKVCQKVLTRLDIYSPLLDEEMRMYILRFTCNRSNPLLTKVLWSVLIFSIAPSFSHLKGKNKH